MKKKNLEEVYTAPQCEELQFESSGALLEGSVKVKGKVDKGDWPDSYSHSY